ncbi:MAG: glycerophosphodiester phosphodiesterase [Gammaproteobacteria bacterium]|nr:glycerophosphodiester phosphodiesterase [Gammaproteobacteria bacterium]
MAVPELIGHRGYPRRYPENTLVSIDAAIAVGARYVEVDVQLTRDLVPVLFHDENIRRVCGMEGTVSHYTFEELRRFPASEPGRFGTRYAHERIPALAELATLLARHPDVTIFVELKREALDSFGIETMLTRVAHDLESVRTRCVLISFVLVALAPARAAGWRVGAVIEHWRERKQKALQVLAPEFLFCDVNGLPWWGKLRFPGAKVVIYEVDDTETARKLAARGVDLIETFAIGELRAAFGG